MASAQTSKPDHWSSEAYAASAPFVPALTSKLLAHLTPHLTSTTRLLDLGAGDGPLTAQLAMLIGPRGRVLGLDSSPAMVAAATQKHSSGTKCAFEVADCGSLGTELARLNEGEEGAWDIVFSNAALHWILRPDEARERVWADVRKALKPGGVFVAEMGGAGNVGEVHAALIAALTHAGVPLLEARDASPWFFPSEAWVRAKLETAGFRVETCETEYRPTKLTEEQGIDGWVRLMGARFLDAVGEGCREGVVAFVREVLRGVCWREEGRAWWVGYVRVRFVARRV